VITATRKLAIAETKSLGNRQYLVVASYEDKKFLLSVCPGRIELLTPLDGSSPAKLP
jgi:flagellar protein FliO/FliZ